MFGTSRRMRDKIKFYFELIIRTNELELTKNSLMPNIYVERYKGNI